MSVDSQSVASLYMTPANDELVWIRDYDPAWPHAFSILAARVRVALGGLVVAVEHIGHLAFRNALRADGNLRDRYGPLKRASTRLR
jgi:GrpB-like predicted nucleotidyltransferase (UPF0157 family)